MKIKYKLMGVFLVLATLIGSIGYFGIKSASRIAESFQQTENEAVPSLTLLLEMSAATRLASINSMEYATRRNALDRTKAQDALANIKEGLSKYSQHEITYHNPSVGELETKIRQFIAVIESYLSIVKGPSLEVIISEEATLHKTRKNLINELNKVAGTANAQQTIALLEIESAARNVSLMSLEFALRGIGDDKIAAINAMLATRSAMNRYIKLATQQSAVKIISQMLDLYLSVSKTYLDQISEGTVPVSILYDKENEVHKVREDLVQKLYPLIEKEKTELMGAADATRESISNTLNILFVSVLVVITMALLTGVGIAYSISKPLNMLSVAAIEVANGNLDAEINIRSKDEIGELASSFEHMKAELKAHRDNLGELVSHRTAALETSNRELESFSYSVAHDLRAPLRTITSFSQILKEDIGDKLSVEDAANLDRVIRAGLHLAQLIDDILNLARISRQEMYKSAVNLSAFAHTTADQLQDTTVDKKVDWKIQEGVSVDGDPWLLEVAMQNLLDNAYKYSSKTKNPAIEFGASNANGKIVYYVRDKGTGFDMKYADKMFGPFQRLHGDEFEGTGIGLATVERIIHRHGGEIWAESVLGKGATFYFTLGNKKAEIKSA